MIKKAFFNSVVHQFDKQPGDLKTYNQIGPIRSY